MLLKVLVEVEIVWTQTLELRSPKGMDRNNYTSSRIAK